MLRYTGCSSRPRPALTVPLKGLGGVPRTRGAVCTGAYTGAVGDAPPAVFYSSFYVYKTKGALCVTQSAAKWNKSDKENWYVDRPGGLFLQFAKSKGGDNKKDGYDWENGIKVCLDVMELGHLLEDPPAPFEIVHDPRKGQAGEGTQLKIVKFAVTPQDSKMPYPYSMTAELTGKGVKEKSQVWVSLSHSEMETIRTLAEHIIPKAVGFDLVFNNYLRVGSETLGRA